MLCMPYACVVHEVCLRYACYMIVLCMTYACVVHEVCLRYARQIIMLCAVHDSYQSSDNTEPWTEK